MKKIITIISIILIALMFTGCSRRSATKSVRLDYIKDDDEQIPLYDSLFNKMVNEGNSYVDIYSAIHYIVPRVMSRQFIDDEGKEIKNRFGYLKSSIESNIRKLNSYNEELYPEDDDSPFWDNYEFIDRERR